MKIKQWPTDPRARIYNEQEEEVFRQLSKRMTDQMQMNESVWLPKIYKFTTTPEQGKVLLELPKPAEEIAKKLEVDVQFVKDTIQDQFEKGMIVNNRRGHWNLCRGDGQLHNACLPTRKYENAPWWRDFEDTWDAWYGCEIDERDNERWGQKNLSRIVCDPRVLKTLPPEDVSPFDDLGQILSAIPPIAYEPCSCRREVMRRECHAPENTCFVSARAAEYNIQRGSAWEVSAAEALEVDYKGMDWGMVAKVSNSRKVRGVVCVCHADKCCASFHIPLKYGKPLHFVASRYRPEVDPTKCKGCQTCIDTCSFGATELKAYDGDKHPVHPFGKPRYKAWVNPDKCMGCGNCVMKCPNGARTMKVVHPLSWIPEELKSALEAE